MSPILFAAFGWLILGAGTPPGDACSLCQDQKVITCRTCTGKGTARIDCGACAGKGSLECPTEAKLNPIGERKGIGPRKGKIPCPNRTCWGGTMRWENGDTDACLACGRAGLVKCPQCRGGEIACGRCDRKKSEIRPCPDCRGSGRWDCPACSASPVQSICLWCRGDESPCSACAGKGVASATCAACAGEKKSHCGDCLGLQRVTCSKCGGAGKSRTRIINAKDGKELGIERHRCDVCKGRGVTPCDLCEGGKTVCRPCKASGRVSAECPQCSGTGGRGCGGCKGGGFHAFEVAGDVLLQAGLKERARSYYVSALRRALAHYDIELDPSATEDSEKVWLLKTLLKLSPPVKETLRRLQDAIDAIDGK